MKMYSNNPPNTTSDYCEVRYEPSLAEIAIESGKEALEGLANGHKQNDTIYRDIKTSSTSDNQANTGSGSGYGQNSYGQGCYGS